MSYRLNLLIIHSSSLIYKNALGGTDEDLNTIEYCSEFRIVLPAIFVYFNH